MISYSTPGKLMLLGEYAVLENQPCIVTAIDKYVTVTAAKSVTQEVVVNSAELDQRFVRSAIEVFEKEFTHSVQKVVLTIQSDITGYGLGSSAAVTVAVLGALLELFKWEISEEKLFSLAFTAVKNVQETGSGFDIAASIWGGTLLYQKEPFQATSLPFELGNYELLVIFTGEKANTVEMIKKVEEFKEQNAQLYIDLTKQMGKIVMQGEIALKNNDWQLFGKLMNQNQKLLKQLGISTPKIDRLVEKCLEYGAVGAKISGAGGGDCVIVLVEKKKAAKIVDSIDNGLKILPVKVNSQTSLK